MVLLLLGGLPLTASNKDMRLRAGSSSATVQVPAARRAAVAAGGRDVPQVHPYMISVHFLAECCPMAGLATWLSALFAGGFCLPRVPSLQQHKSVLKVTDEHSALHCPAGRCPCSLISGCFRVWTRCHSIRRSRLLIKNCLMLLESVQSKHCTCKCIYSLCSAINS